MQQKAKGEFDSARPGTPWKPGQFFWLELAAITVIAALLRTYHLGEASFWRDELRTIMVCANLDTSGMFKSKILGYVPTAIGLWLSGVDPLAIPAKAPETWIDMGITEQSARTPSALIGIISIPLLAVVGRRVLGAQAAIVASLLLSIAPWHIYWSQASRFYTQQFLFYNLGLLFFFLATVRPSRGIVCLASVCALLAVLTQPTALVLFAVFGAYLVVAASLGHDTQIPWGTWLLIGPLAIGAAALIADVLMSPQDWLVFLRGSAHSPIDLLFATGYFIGPPVGLFALSVTLRLVTTNDRLGLYLALGALVPILAFAAAALLLAVGSRYTLLCLFSWLALAALGTSLVRDALDDRVGPILCHSPLLLLVAALAVPLYGYYEGGRGYHPRWRDAFAFVEAKRASGDAAMMSPGYVELGKYYLRDPSVRGYPQRDELTSQQTPAWIVLLEGHDPAWMGEIVELRASYDLHVVAPRLSVRVYYKEGTGPAPPAPEPID